MAIIKTAVKRRVAVSMIYGAIVIYGVVAIQKIPIDLLPEIEFPMLAVISVWAGASAEDVERNVTNLLEERFSMIQNMKEITSVSRENISVVSIHFEYGTDLNEASNQVRDALDMASRFLPEDVDSPTLFRIQSSFIPVIVFGIYSLSGDIDRYADFIRDNIADPLGRVAGVATVIPINTPSREIHVEVDPFALANRGLSLQGISDVIAASNLNMPLGNLEVSSLDYTLSFPGAIENLQQLEELVVGAGTYGDPIRLEQVATVTMTTEERRGVSEVNNHRSAILMVQKQGGANTVQVARDVTAQLERLRDQIPSELEIIIVADTSQGIVDMIDNLQSALVFGGLMVVLVVFLFIQRIGPSLIISLSIPSSLLFVLLLMYLFGYTLNFVTLVAMVLAIGMVVDNSIVILEHIVTQVEKGRPAMQAAMTAPYEVAPAVLASTLTTISIFAPLIFISGLVGVLFTELSVVMIAALSSSLISSVILTPMLAGWWLHTDRKNTLGRLTNGIRRVTQSPLRFVEWFYAKVLAWALGHKLIVLLVIAGIIAGTVFLIEEIKVDFGTKMDSQQVEFTVHLPQGTDVSLTEQVGRRIVEILAAQPEVENYFLTAGAASGGMVTAFGGSEGSHIANVSARLIPLSQRTRRDYEVAEDIRAMIEDWPEIASLVVRAGGSMEDMMSGGGRALQVFIVGNDLEEIESASEQVVALLGRIEGVESPATTAFNRRPELAFIPDRQRMSELAIPIAMAGLSLRSALVGSTASRIQYGGHDIPVRVRYEERFREQLDDLHRLEVPSVLGHMVPVSAFTHLEEHSSLIEIRHKDRARIAIVDADVYGRPLGDIITDLETGLAQLELPPDVHVEMGGQIEVQTEMLSDLMMLLLLAVVLVFMVMAGQFESLIDPFVIMVSIPFAFTGTFLFLTATGTVLSMFSFIGLIILVGIVVNNAIVMVDYINLQRSRGLEVNEAILSAGRSRVRPVLMTAVTTIGGMFPLATAVGTGSEMWRPIGLAVIGGLAVSTVVTLILVPVFYRILEPFRVFKRRKWAAEQQEREALAGEGATS